MSEGDEELDDQALELELGLWGGGITPDDPIEAHMESRRRVEAVLFASDRAVPAKRLRDVLFAGVELAEILMELKADYADRGVILEEVAGKWRFHTAPDLAFLFEETRHEVRKLSQAAMETLAIIAYGGPVSRAEIEAVRGVAVSKTIIDTLLDTGWVRPAGQREVPGRPMTYKTTPLFLEEYGLASLDHLPGKAELKAEGLLDPMPPAADEPDSDEAPDDDASPNDVEFVQDYNSDDEET